MPPTIMNRGLIVPLTRTRRSIAQLSVSVPSRHTQFSVAFTTNIAESNFWYTQAKIVIEQWRKHYNTIRPHSALNYRPPAPQSFAPLARHLDEIMPMQ